MRSARGQPVWVLFLLLTRVNKRGSTTTGQSISENSDSTDLFLSVLEHLMCTMSGQKHRESAYCEGPHEGFQSTRGFLACFQRQYYAGWNVWYYTGTRAVMIRCIHLSAQFCLCFAQFDIYTCAHHHQWDRYPWIYSSTDPKPEPCRSHAHPLWGYLSQSQRVKSQHTTYCFAWNISMGFTCEHESRIGYKPYCLNWNK